MTAQNVPCKLVTTPIGWWLQFPNNWHAGLVFDTTQEKIAFVKSCGLDLPEADIPYLDLDEITECPIGWYEQGVESSNSISF